MTTAYISHNDCALHDMGPEHPESPSRLAAIINQIQGTELEQMLEFVRAEEIQRVQLQRVHPEMYLHQLDLISPERGRVMADPDTIIMPHTLRAARLAAGAVSQGVDMVLSNQVTNAFCAVRPPGHHAERSKTMGFCFYNNIAVAACQALTFHHLERVAIVDFDVHQGNGTIDIFNDDPRVMVCSSFQHPYYPFSHYHNLGENIVNVPLDAHTDGKTYRHRIERDWLPQLETFKPQLILISAGFDGHRLDPMAEMNLEDEDYGWITERIVEIAEKHCNGRVVSSLEGGYHLEALARSVEAHLKALAGMKP
ncbi:MAG: deacetylase [Alteromonadaceae bacterium]|nr:deacetylase [Alteromonadaceae bacterium]|tara:strand:- start:3148 stop:4077 length:930 start_codon:yes stop_codon:yes gene_type:complete